MAQREWRSSHSRKRMMSNASSYGYRSVRNERERSVNHPSRARSAPRARRYPPRPPRYAQYLHPPIAPAPERASTTRKLYTYHKRARLRLGVGLLELADHVTRRVLRRGAVEGVEAELEVLRRLTERERVAAPRKQTHKNSLVSHRRPRASRNPRRALHAATRPTTRASAIARPRRARLIIAPPPTRARDRYAQSAVTRKGTIQPRRAHGSRTPQFAANAKRERAFVSHSRGYAHRRRTHSSPARGAFLAGAAAFFAAGFAAVFTGAFLTAVFGAGAFVLFIVRARECLARSRVARVARARRFFIRRRPATPRGRFAGHRTSVYGLARVRNDLTLKMRRTACKDSDRSDIRTPARSPGADRRDRAHRARECFVMGLTPRVMRAQKGYKYVDTKHVPRERRIERSRCAIC